jgi:hypothetical protein
MELSHQKIISSEWLLLNANSATFQLYHDENKLIFNEIMMSSALPEDGIVPSHIIDRPWLFFHIIRQIIRYVCPNLTMITSDNKYVV